MVFLLGISCQDFFCIIFKVSSHLYPFPPIKSVLPVSEAIGGVSEQIPTVISAVIRHEVIVFDAPRVDLDHSAKDQRSFSINDSLQLSFWT